VLYQLSELFGAEAVMPLDYCERNWGEEAYCNGGPVSVGTPGAMMDAAVALRLPFDRLILLYLSHAAETMQMQLFLIASRLCRSPQHRGWALSQSTA